MIIEGYTAVKRYTAFGKHNGTDPKFPISPTGKEVVIEGYVFYHLENGKIVEFIEYSNFLGLFHQIGLVPPIEQGGQ